MTFIILEGHRRLLKNLLTLTGKKICIHLTLCWFNKLAYYGQLINRRETVTEEVWKQSTKMGKDAKISQKNC